MKTCIRKKSLSLLLSFLLCLGMISAAVPVRAEGDSSPVIIASGSCGANGDNLTWTLNDSGLLTISGTGAMSSSASSNWSSYTDSITAIKVEEGVTTLGNSSFGYCSVIRELSLPASLTSIGSNAFSTRYRGKITDVWFAGTVEQWQAITGKSFSTQTFIHILGSEIVASGSCGTGVSYELDNSGVLTISGSGVVSTSPASRWESSVSSIIVEAGVTAINQSMIGSSFYNLETVTLPEGLTSIGNNNFQCGKLSSIRLPSTLTSIGTYVFDNSSLTSLVIPEGVTSLPQFCRNCESLTSISIPASVTGMSLYAFTGCTALREITVDPDSTFLCAIDNVLYSKDQTELLLYPRGSESTSFTVPSPVTTIAYGAFQGSPNLTSLTFGSTVTTLSESVASQCPNLTSVTIEGSVTSLPSYAFAENPSLRTVTLPNTLKSIGEECFHNCASLETVSLPAGITSIGQYAFNGCTSLDNATYGGTAEQWASVSVGLGNVPLRNALHYSDIRLIYDGTCGSNLMWTLDENGLLTITGTGPMSDWSSVNSVPWYSYRSQITSVSLPDGLTSIGGHAFDGCRNLTDITIPASVTSVSEYAFAGTGITEITVNDLSSHIFDNCTSLVRVTLSENLRTINKYAFYGCTALTDVTIPAGVTTIEEYAFFGCAALTSLSIPDGVTTIGQYAFKNCTALASIAIPDGVTAINQYTFSGCTGLTSVTIPDSVTVIYNHAFDGCSGLTSVTLPANLKTLDSYAFQGCTGLTGATFTGSVTTIGSYAFNRCTSLASVTIPAGATTFGQYAFQNCTALREFTIPDGTTSIGQYVFNGCTGLTEVTIPDSVTAIEANAFNGCSSLAYVSIPDSVTTIGNYAFLACSGLTTVRLPDTLTTLGLGVFKSTGLVNLSLPNGLTGIPDSTFSGCSKLTSITIPASVVSIGSKAFENCNALTDVYYEGTDAQWAAITIGSYNTRLTNGAVTIHCSAYVPLASGDCGDSLSWSLSQGGVLTITGTGEMWNFADAASTPWAAYQTRICSISLPDGIISIGNHAFEGCTALTAIVIPEGVIRIGAYAFSGCSNLVGVLLPTSLYSIGAYAFAGCAMTGVSLPSSIYYVGDGAFEYCPRLTRIDIPETVVFVGDDILADTPAEATIPHIPSNPRTTLTELIIPEGVTAIEAYAFCQCSALRSVTLPGSLLSIGEGAFAECVLLDNVVLPDSLTLIEDKTFSGCSGLTVITIPSSVTRIGDAAFDGCDSLSDVYFSGSRAQWNAITVGIDNEALSRATIHTVERLTISIPEAQGYCGRTVTVPVTVEGNPGLASITVSVNYDPEVLELTGAQVMPGFASMLGATTLVNPRSGRVTLTWVLTSGECTANGAFAELTFLVAADAPEGETALTISYDPENICNEALESVTADTVDGSILISSHLPGDVNGDGKVNNKDAILVLRYVAEFEVDANMTAMDVNADGSVNVVDALLLLRYVAGFDVTLY